MQELVLKWIFNSVASRMCSNIQLAIMIKQSARKIYSKYLMDFINLIRAMIRLLERIFLDPVISNSIHIHRFKIKLCIRVILLLKSYLRETLSTLISACIMWLDGKMWLKLNLLCIQLTFKIIRAKKLLWIFSLICKIIILFILILMAWKCKRERSISDQLGIYRSLNLLLAITIQLTPWLLYRILIHQEELQFSMIEVKELLVYKMEILKLWFIEGMYYSL